MTIDGAIRELEHPSWLLTTNHTTEYDEAVMLGVEALKAVKAMRHYPFPDEILCLPGETED